MYRNTKFYREVFACKCFLFNIYKINNLINLYYILLIYINQVD